MCTMPKSCTTNLVPGQAGMSLIELMVGVVIGMLTILIVANTIITSEGQRRGTSSGSDAQNNAMLAAYLVERDLRMSGYGIFTNETGGVSEVCSVGTVRTYNANRATTDLNYAGDLPFVPVLINPTSIPAADIGSDIIMLNYAGGSLGVVGAGVKFAGNSATTANNYKIENIGGFRAGDLALVAQAGLNCTISEVTGLDAINSQVLRGTDSYANDYKGGGMVTPAWNKAGGLGVDYTTAARLYNLGPPDQFISVVYAVRNQQLTRCDLMISDCLSSGGTGNPNVWVPIAGNIVALRAEMGVDSDGDRKTDAWRERPCAGAACTATFSEWRGVKAVRLVVVARSAQFSKEEVTTTAPTWQGQTSISLGHLADWTHYRYGSVELVTPVRNIVLWSTL